MKRSSWSALVFLLTAGMAVAQNLTTLPYQGHLTDRKGNPITSPVLMTFTLCSGGDPADPSACGGGTVAYTEMATLTPGSGGLFTYQIGTGHAPPDLSLAVFSPIQPLYLEVSIGTEVLLPRKLVVLNQDTAASASYSLDGLAAPGAAGLATTGDINTGTQYNIRGDRVLSVPGFNNTFVGVGTGRANTTGLANAFFGTLAGFANTTGAQNAFFGSGAGLFNTTGNSNAFFGSGAGSSNTTGNNNAFFGQSAGFSNTTGFENAFFGTGAGGANTTGDGNAFFGTLAGLFNTTGVRNAFFGTGAGRNHTTGAQNAFFGTSAGLRNTTGSDNAFFGDGAGFSNTTENSNTFLGASADGVAGITNATAIGAGAVVTRSNALVLGHNADIGIGTSAPQAKLHIQGGHLLVGSPGRGLILRSPDGATCRLLTIDDAGAMVLAPIACP